MPQYITSSEKFVYEVCQKSFLSLWSYVNPRGRDAGRELCDILIVCDPHIIVFSVKDIKLTNSGRLEVDWDRWERKAIDESVIQIRGAIRWLDKADHVVKKDGSVGLPLPPRGKRVYHRIAVACGGGRKVPITTSAQKGEPLAHVFDEKSFSLILRHLDTITDFVDYLQKKEDFLDRATICMDDGEENLLAVFLHNGMAFPEKPDLVFLDGSLWDVLKKKAKFRAKLERDKDSYVWDRLIESFCIGGFEDDNWRGPGMAESEVALRVLAKEDRYSRRMLGRAFRQFLELRKAGKVRARIATSQLGVTYVFFGYSADSTPEDRKAELTARCLASLCRFPNAHTVIGIDINGPGEKPICGYTSDLVMLQTDQGAWPKEFLERAERIRDELGYFKKPNVTHVQAEKF